MIPENCVDDQSLARVQDWLTSCTSSSDHMECGKNTDVPLPKRVLDLQYYGKPSVRLLASEGQTGSYIALSYCWGKTSTLTTTTSNLSKLRSGITWTELPEAFQSVIKMTRYLGIRYCWIDALCIIQGPYPLI